MVEFYLMRIGAGKLTLEQVPPRWYEEVEKRLKED